MSGTKGSSKVSKKTAGADVSAVKQMTQAKTKTRSSASSGRAAEKTALAATTKSKKGADAKQAEETTNHANVEAYIGSLSGWQSSVVRTICNIVRATAPNATETIKASQPIYEENGPFCYVKAFSGSVSFGFWRGAELNDPRRLLKSDGDRMKHVKLTGERDVDPRAFAAFVKQAVELNRRLGDPSR